MSKQIATYSPQNRFSFTCPIFNVATEIRLCLHLRDLLWAGKRQDARRGCQACLHDSKCPIVPMVSQITRTGQDPGYYAAEPRHGSLKPELLARTENVVVMDKTLLNFDVGDAERKAILRANEMAGKNAPHVERSAPRKSKPIAKAIETVIDAAKSGDLGAAISGEAA
jgi:hypothetical protein